MPELPEVETTVRELRPHLLDAVVEALYSTPKGESHFNKPLAQVQKALIGKSFTSIDRIGKWILLEFEETKIVAHLRMSGRFLVGEEGETHPHRRFWFHIKNAKTTKRQLISFIDVRRFGTFHLFDDFAEAKSLNQLGPDALSLDFNAEQLHSMLSKKLKPIYSSLLDQHIVAGLGNIYVNEVLNNVGLHPLTPSNKISPKIAETIVAESKKILTMALEFRGTTLVDNQYKSVNGDTGSFAKLLKVYGKHKDPSIQVLKIGGRSVFVRKELEDQIQV